MKRKAWFASVCASFNVRPPNRLTILPRYFSVFFVSLLLTLITCAPVTAQNWMDHSIDGEFFIYFENEMDVGIRNRQGQKVISPRSHGVGPLFEFADCGTFIVTKHFGLARTPMSFAGIIDRSTEHYFVMIKAPPNKVDGPLTLAQFSSHPMSSSTPISWQTATPPTNRLIMIGAIIIGVIFLVSIITTLVIMRSAAKTPVADD